VNNLTVSILAIILLLALDLLIAASRSALLNTRQSRVDALNDMRDRDLDALRELISRRARVRAAHKLAQTVLRFLIMGILLALWLPAGDQSPTTLLILLLVVLFAVVVWLGEFIVEGIVLQSPEDWALLLQPVGQFLITFLYPFIIIPLRLAKSSETNRNLVIITEDELMNLVDASQQAGQIDTEAREMIHNVFQLDDTLAREIMIPRVDALMLEVNTPLKEAADIVLESGYSRLPIYRESQDDILGLLYAKDLIRVWREGVNSVNSLDSLKRQAYFVPETKNALELLNEMQSQRIHMAIVVDEYGGIAGLVTLEDIVEEILGEIQDEFDEGEEELFEQINDQEYLFNGRMPLHEINDLLDADLSDEDADTLGGLIYSRVGRVPEVGDTLREDGIQLTVEEITDRRIRRVRALRLGEDEAVQMDEESNNNER
jgi:CBS domain containing-hemolysin-like protein